MKAKAKEWQFTIPILKLIKKNLRKSSFNNVRKHLIWSTSTLAFCGGFRIHELLSKERQSYDPFVTLLGKDIVLKENDKYPNIQILLKTQKKRPNRQGRSCWCLVQTILFYAQSKPTKSTNYHLLHTN